MHAEFDAYCRERGAPGLPGTELIHESPYLNLYLYPDELDYTRTEPLAVDVAQPPDERAHD